MRSSVFSTLGCTDLDLAGACDQACTHGIEGIELRALEGRIDLPGYFAGLRVAPEEISKCWREQGIEVRGMDSSARLTGGKPKARALRFGRLGGSIESPLGVRLARFAPSSMC
jgi:hypothetical protein